MRCNKLTYCKGQCENNENVIITYEIVNKWNLIELESAEKPNVELTPKALISNMLKEEKTQECHQIGQDNYKMLEVIGTHAQWDKNGNAVDFPRVIANNKSVCGIEKEDEYSVSNDIREEAEDNENEMKTSKFYKNKLLDTEISFVALLNINYEMSKVTDILVSDVQNIVENDEATEFDRVIDDNVSICSNQKKEKYGSPWRSESNNFPRR